MKGHPQRRYFKFSNESAENLLGASRRGNIYSGSLKVKDVGSFSK